MINENDLRDANLYWEINRNYEIKTGRGVKAKCLALLRRISCKIGGILLQPILTKQVLYNAATVRVLNSYNDEIVHLKEDSMHLNDEIARLKFGISCLEEKIKKEKVDLREESLYLNNELVHVKLVITCLEEKIKNEQEKIDNMIEDSEFEAIKKKQMKKIIMGEAYRKFEYMNRGNSEEIKKRLKFYSENIKRVKNTNKEPLFALDLGCGHGEWLEIMQELGIAALGVDIDNVLLESCQKRGLNVINEDLFMYLKNIASNAVDVVTLFQVAEHLPIRKLIDSLHEVKRVLRPGGILIVETPNPENLVIGGHDFYLDPTRITKLSPNLLLALAKDAGFPTVDLSYLNPCQSLALKENKESKGIYKKINFLNNYADYAIITYKDR